MDRGEEVSGANLDALFLEWVWVPDYASRELEARRAAYDLVNTLKTRAAGYGFEGVPNDIQTSLDSWSFKSIGDKVTRANEALDGYAALLTASDAAGLDRSSAVADTWSESTISQIEGVIQQQRRVVDAFVNAAESIAEEPADSNAWGLLDDARVAYAEGDLAAASELAAAAAAFVYNQFASVQMIEIADIEGDLYKENFLKRIGMLFENPEADLDAAHAALEAGNTEEAVRLARQAFETWNGAQARGLQRLAILAGAMSALTFGSWFLLRRVDFGRDDGEISASRARLAVEGNPPPPSKRSWRDWENNS
jgi:hypothetical protein